MESIHYIISIISRLHLFWRVINKIMNFLPIINRPKKFLSFSNPLNGLVYHNSQDHISSPQKAPLATISYISSSRNREPAKLSVRKANSNIRFNMGRSNESKSLVRAALYKSSNLMKEVNMDEQDRKLQEPQRSISTQRPSLHYIFPDVQIIPLHLIQKYEDIAANRLRFSLQKYFRLYFHQNIRQNCKRLNDKLETYLPLLRKYKMMNEQINRKKWPKQFWDIKNTEELLQWFQKFQKNSSQYWTRHILVLIQIYCVPHKDLRKTALDDIILAISKLACGQGQKQVVGQEYILILESGLVVEDILDIPFSTKKLFFSTKAQAGQQLSLFDNFAKMVRQYHQECKKRGFVGRLRSHFRHSIVANKYDEDTINYEVDFVQKDRERKSSMMKAAALLQRKKNENKKKFANNYSLLRSSRLKSKDIMYSAQTEEDVVYSESISPHCFHIELASKQLQTKIVDDFHHYHDLSVKQNSAITSQQIYISVLEKYDPVLSQLLSSTFHSRRMKDILEQFTKQKLAGDRMASRQTMTWKQFIQFSVISSNNLQKLVHIPDCLQLVRTFVEGCLNMTNQDYFRQQLTSKLYNMIEGDAEQLILMQEVIWSWLSENGFLLHGAIQRELLWTWESRSRLFYLLMVAMILGTYKTTPMDLAYEMLA